MFLISGTYNGNFLWCKDRLVYPSDLSFFDFRNYRGAIPSKDEVNLIIQKLEFSTRAGVSSHLMVSLCVGARDIVGRPGFLACRRISNSIPDVLVSDWLVESVRQLGQYLKHRAPLVDGAVVGVPVLESNKTIDISHLKSKLDHKRIAHVNVNWQSESGLRQVLGLISDDLLSLESFTLVFGSEGGGSDYTKEKIETWIQDVRSDERKRTRELEHLRRKRLAKQLKSAEDDRYWEFLYLFAKRACVVLLVPLGVFLVILLVKIAKPD